MVVKQKFTLGNSFPFEILNIDIKLIAFILRLVINNSCFKCLITELSSILLLVFDSYWYTVH